jgi:hypothetical protein
MKNIINTYGMFETKSQFGKIFALMRQTLFQFGLTLASTRQLCFKLDSHLPRRGNSVSNCIYACLVEATLFQSGFTLAPSRQLCIKLNKLQSWKYKK